jgi:predicted transcriptional regulator
MPGDVLDLPIRKRIFDYIRVNPGVHFRVMQRDLELAVGQLDFHINAMLKSEVIVKEHVSGNVGFFVRDKFTKQEKDALSLLRREIPRGIILYLLENPGSNPGTLLEHFTFTGATLSYHLRRLERIGILKAETIGRERKYSIGDEEMVKSLLIMYKDSIVDRIVDRVSR